MKRKGPKPLPLAKRFWPKVTKTEHCWLWNAAKNNKGYGVIPDAVSGERLAHRVSWLLHFGAKAQGLVLHSCDNPSCVRPDDLRVGSQTDNMRDALRRERNHGRSKLSPERVRAIRARAKTGINDLAAIAADFGVTPAAVGHIKYGVTWRWLE